MSNLFVSSIYDLIPRAGSRDDTPGQVALGDLATARAARPQLVSLRGCGVCLLENSGRQHGGRTER